MSEFSLTVLGGISILVFGQVILKFFLEPILEQSKLIGAIASALILYGNVGSESANFAEAKRTYRKQASNLMGTAYNIKCYPLWRRLGLVPKSDDVIEASQALIGISNSLGSTDVEHRRKEIAQLLRIKIISKRFGN